MARRLAVHDDELQAAARAAGLDVEQLANQVHRAARVTCSHARDVDEATELLDMLGLLEDDRPRVQQQSIEDLVDQLVAGVDEGSTP